MSRTANFTICASKDLFKTSAPGSQPLASSTKSNCGTSPLLLLPIESRKSTLYMAPPNVRSWSSDSTDVPTPTSTSGGRGDKPDGTVSKETTPAKAVCRVGMSVRWVIAHSPIHQVDGLLEKSQYEGFVNKLNTSSTKECVDAIYIYRSVE